MRDTVGEYEHVRMPMKGVLLCCSFGPVGAHFWHSYCYAPQIAFSPVSAVNMRRSAYQVLNLLKNLNPTRWKLDMEK